MNRAQWIFTVVMGVVIFSSFGISKAGASSSNSVEVIPDEEISRALLIEPNGYATGQHTAYWPELEMTMVSDQGRIERNAVGTCSNGTDCAYGGASMQGSKLSWSGCGSHPTSALSTVRSIANGRSSRTLEARNGTTVVASATPGKWRNVSKKVTNVYC